MKSLKAIKLWLPLFLCLLFAASAFAAPVSHPIIELDSQSAVSFMPQPAEFASSYIGNSHSGIFHYSWCRYVGRMSENHKVYFDNREDAVDAGYRPCKVCTP